MLNEKEIWLSASPSFLHNDFSWRGFAEFLRKIQIFCRDSDSTGQTEPSGCLLTGFGWKIVFQRVNQNEYIHTHHHSQRPTSTHTNLQRNNWQLPQEMDLYCFLLHEPRNNLQKHYFKSSQILKRTERKTRNKNNNSRKIWQNNSLLESKMVNGKKNIFEKFEGM